jgi:hypothetical protein
VERHPIVDKVLRSYRSGGGVTGYSALDHGRQGVNDWARKRAGKVRRATKKPHLAKERGGLEEGRGARDTDTDLGEMQMYVFTKEV